MSVSRLLLVSKVPFVVLVGATLGLGLSAINGSPIAALTILVGLACACEWLEVRFGHYGSLTLRPVIAFVALLRHGVSGYFATGVLPFLIIRLLTRRDAKEAFYESAGFEVLAMWLGYVASSSISQVTGYARVAGVPIQVLGTTLGLSVFWASHLTLQALRLSAVEGIRLQTAGRHLAVTAWPHVVRLTLAGVALQMVSMEFDLPILILATLVLIEAYYPWKLLGEQESVLLTSLQLMAQAVDLKDPYTSNHSQRVAQYAVRLARAMDIPEGEVEKIRIGALMHDIGKIGISGRIIRKPGKLSAEEQALMKQHSVVSATIIQPLEILGESAEMVRHHHEHWDGSGYPDGLKGNAIPLGSRVILVADAYDALSTDRPYRKGTNKARALGVIRANAGIQFDPIVAEALERIIDSL
jgi:putative nucleotidyltransferase with HDIG domain